MASRFRFGCFEVDMDSGQLYKRGVRIRLREQSFQVLASLLEHHGEVVTREELHRRLWQRDVFVDFDNSLNTAIARLREALSESAEHPHFIETLPKRGYRFLAAVSEAPPSRERTSVKRSRLVVLPFVNLSSDSAEEYFSDAMTDEVITALANLAPEELAVIARTTAMHYKGSHKDVARIGRELNVDYVLEGSLRRDHDLVSINVQLIQTSDQAHVLARKYEKELDNIFGIQGCIAQDVATCIPTTAGKFPSGAPGGRTIQKPSKDVAAYNAYLQGRFHLYKGTPADFAKAGQYLEEALSRDPELALANEALAELYWYLAFFGFAPPKEICAAGLFYALRAVEIDNSLGETHALIGVYRKELDYNWQEVHREMSRALELSPASPIVRLRYAQSELMPQGRLQEAITEIEKALEFDPLSLNNHMWLAVMLWLNRDFDSALQRARRVLELDSFNHIGYLVMGQVLTMQGAFKEAIAALQKSAELSGGSPMVLGWLGLALAQAGNAPAARELLERLHAIAAEAYVPPTSNAWIHLGLNEIDEAFLWLDRAIDMRDPMIIPIKSYCFLDPLRDDPRFTTLLRKMNLA
jgi:TolB-like protein/Tfp pilus assembly protein PilF